MLQKRCGEGCYLYSVFMIIMMTMMERSLIQKQYLVSEKDAVEVADHILPLPLGLG